MAWQDGLDDRQIEAANHAGSHARLLAGPGTGKTVTLTRRLVKLLTDDGVPPESILALAFTRINAYDLHRTLHNALEGSGIAVPHVSTLHSYALRQLLLNAPLITTLPQPLRIADDFEEKYIIRQDLRKTLELTDKEIRGKFADLSSDWESLTVEDAEYAPADPQFMGAWQQHRNLYGYTLRSELVWQLKHAVEENPDAYQFEGEIRYLVVDEYQDLNRCDQAIVRKLADLGAEVYCAGDDDQSIYGFRRAHPAGIRQFIEEYDPSKSLNLDICWRCDVQIIDVSQHVANQDPERLVKPIRPRDGAGQGEVHLLRFGDQSEEAAGVAAICSDLLHQKGLDPDEILILLRSDHQGRYSEVLTSELEARGLAFNVRADAVTPLDETHGRFILSLIRLSTNPNDDLAWRTVFQFSGRQNQIGEATIDAIVRHANENGLRFSAACQQIKENPNIFDRGALIQEEMNEILDRTSGLSILPVPDPDVLHDDAAIAEARRVLLDEVAALCEAFGASEEVREGILGYIRESSAGSVTLAQLLAALTSPENTLDQELDEGKINILSMHRAKGLSARAVFIIAAEEQLIPGEAIGNEYDDARRLLYVSLSRAKEYLWITYCNERSGRQQHSGSDPGNPRRTLTPFLRSALPVQPGPEYIRQAVPE
ncbi:MAG: ATP-dependent helicase [Anaerolineales bacterium]